jgi:hypothetical protein
VFDVAVYCHTATGSELTLFTHFYIAELREALAEAKGLIVIVDDPREGPRDSCRAAQTDP